MSTRLTLYGRKWCHLCHEMEVALRALKGEYDFDIELVDIDEHPGLETLYDEKVPVLMLGQRELCHHFFAEAAVRAVLCEIR